MAIYKSIHTTIGLAALAAAETSGTPINLTHMAVGDGNGNFITPTEDMTALVREVYRTTVNRVYQDPDDETKFYAEMVIPASEGGFVLREVGVFDADGDMHVIANLPDAYKPETTDGAFGDTMIRITFVVANADNVTIIVDPDVVVVTQQWINNNINACYIAPGGTTGQVWTKQSNACGDAEWQDPDVANVIVDAIEEEQTLAASQTQVDLATVTTNSLAVYIEGVRIPRKSGSDGWLPASAPNDLTRIILGKSYPAGHKILMVQNDPLGTATDPLSRALNLSDLPDAAAARTNLGVYSKAEADQKAPVSAVMGFLRTTAPTGWLKCNGAAVSRTTYADLFAVIGTTYGAGNGSTTFNLPDFRGEFPRFLDDGRGIDTGRALGQWQAQQFTVPLDNNWPGTDLSGPYNDPGYLASPYNGADGHKVVYRLKSTGGRVVTTGDTRPRNVALLACIKF